MSSLKVNMITLEITGAEFRVEAQLLDQSGVDQLVTLLLTSKDMLPPQGETKCPPL